MKGPTALCAAGVLSLLLALPAAPGIAKETREQRVRKFQDSLGEEVVRGSGPPVPPGEKAALVQRVLLATGSGLLLVAGVHMLLKRSRERRRIEETRQTYLTENLMTPEAVRDHLRRVAAGRIPLSAWVDDHFIRFSTRFDEIPGEGSVFAILPLSPAAGNDMLRNSTRVRFEYLYEKVPYRFDSAWKEERGEGGSFLHRCALPERIHFTQRRDSYRVEPPLSSPVTCSFPDRLIPALTVNDIGLGGYSVTSSTRFRPGEEVKSCRIGGGGMLPLEASARCVYELPLTEVKSKFQYRYGFRFTRLAAGSAKRLTHFLSRRQVADLSRRKAMEQ